MFCCITLPVVFYMFKALHHLQGLCCNCVSFRDVVAMVVAEATAALVEGLALRAVGAVAAQVRSLPQMSRSGMACGNTHGRCCDTRPCNVGDSDNYGGGNSDHVLCSDDGGAVQSSQRW